MAASHQRKSDPETQMDSEQWCVKSYIIIVYKTSCFGYSNVWRVILLKKFPVITSVVAAVPLGRLKYRKSPARAAQLHMQRDAVTRRKQYRSTVYALCTLEHCNFIFFKLAGRYEDCMLYGAVGPANRGPCNTKVNNIVPPAMDSQLQHWL